MDLWPSGFGIGLFRSMHTEFLLCGFDTAMRHFFFITTNYFILWSCVFVE